MAQLTKAIARLMEERERTQQTPIAEDDLPKLREVIDLVRAKLPAGERPLAETLTRQLFHKAETDLLESGTIDELAMRALAIFRIVNERAESEPYVRLTAPNESGWGSSCWTVQTRMLDRPFIVDTVLETLREHGCLVRHMLHPVLTVERDAAGVLLAIGSPGEPGQAESALYIEVEQIDDAETISRELTEALCQLIQVTNDSSAMHNKAEEIASELRHSHLPHPWSPGVDELAAFLEWLGQKNFIFLGYREYRFDGSGSDRTATVRRGSGLGLLRDETRSHYAQSRPLTNALRRVLSEPPLQMISKTNAESPIHRRTHMDDIAIKELDAAGIVIGERRFLGLFTAQAYAQEAMNIPLLRMKLAAILQSEGAPVDSHSYKQIVDAFNSLSRVELLAVGVNELHRVIRTIIDTSGSRETRIIQNRDLLDRGSFISVVIPKERFSDELARHTESRLIEILEARAALERRIVIDETDQVRMHFYLVPHGDHLRQVPEDELQNQIQSLIRTWDERLLEALLEAMPRDQARNLAARYSTILSRQYKAATPTAAAVRDIGHLEALSATRTPQMDLVPAEDSRFSIVKLYTPREELVLSEFLPVLENLGLKVFAQNPIALDLPGFGGVLIHSFYVQDSRGGTLEPDKTTSLLRPAILLLYRHKLGNDPLNALILNAGLEWRRVDLLRTYVNHAAQISSSPSRTAIIGALVNNPASARTLWEYFDAKFNPVDPASPREREKIRLPEIVARFTAGLEAVESVLDDCILRNLLAAVIATVRTNYYKPGDLPPEPGPLAIKIDFRQWPDLPQPQPAYEIYVHAQEVEGVHLRGAKVARGGIRHSDRPDDFRTEVLDLMGTQMVKNAVIVPAGAKGGFVVQRPRGTTPTAAQAVAAYRTFIATLLDLTDNIVQGRIESPPGILLYDDLDPYLVVAADKGTASFSDIANEIAQQRRFWLGDAFASGGSHGYDHKKEGITARGAWECVQRHLREAGHDIERETLRVVGIGDMSGDVFGNGLLRSRQFQLVAAFNHLHIFLDPNPDPALSYAERERLFHLPRSTWADYNAALISEGGGVFARSAKRIPLSPPVRQMLGIDYTEATTDEVIRAILKMSADLLWNGGIGTYVKASDESHATVADSTNDAVRVDGRDLRVKIVGEGGNLGFTQRGRIEYALNGGRLNTDAIDNSAGVDMSDHEVNLKICLAGAIEAGQLTRDERNRLLTELEESVMAQVLSHNRHQARALSLDQLRSRTKLNLFRDHAAALESEGYLDRRLANLPDRETLRNRRATFLGLTRPELAVLLAHSKLALQHKLVASVVPDDPFFERYLRSYFADTVNQRFGLSVRAHRLRREIIAVQSANTLIDMMGMTFVTRLARDSGCDPAVVVHSWDIVATASGLIDLWAEISEAQPPLPLGAEYACAMALERALEKATLWFLATQPIDVPATDMLDALIPPLQDLLPLVPDILPESEQAQFHTEIERLAAEGTPRTLATRVLLLDRLAELFEIAEIAAGLEIERPVVAESFYRVSELLELNWIYRAIEELPADDRWERGAIEELRQSVASAHRQVTTDVASYRAATVDDSLASYLATREQDLSRVRNLICDIKASPRVSLAALVVAARELSRLIQPPA